ncbi:hypothetical protein EZV62_026830 [Acer yangbiense]|uniref:SGNH hydrolase-type esterase domain-containing protein n=1 Tax=Acer yangbiense TaxID=1000413 RepID=A0A5C7GTW6_9ROSI|nr:hypothetical protein EZV62_026830 [Acer yangbiense]
MRPKIYLFGDSITEESFCSGGWGSSLAHHFSRTLDVVLRGYSGYNTSVLNGSGGGTPLKPLRLVPNEEWWGGGGVPELCATSFLFCLQNQWPTTLILLMTPPPIDEEGRLKHPYVENATGLPERTNEAAGAYAKACIEVSGERGIPVIDLWTKMQKFPDWQKVYLSDGLHLTPTGNRVVFEELVVKLRENSLSLEKLPVDLPLISEIDTKDPLKAFEK